MLAVGVEFAVLADTIDFVDEDDRRAVLGGLAEELAHALRADADKDFREIAAVRAEETSICFTSNSFSEHSLAGSRRTDEQHALGQVAPEALVFSRFAQKIHDLLHLALGFLDTGNLAKSNGRSMSHMCAFAFAQIHLPHEHENDDPADEKCGNNADPLAPHGLARHFDFGAVGFEQSFNLDFVKMGADENALRLVARFALPFELINTWIGGRRYTAIDQTFTGNELFEFGPREFFA